MAEEKASNFFPNTNFSGEGDKGWFSKTDFSGCEEISIPVESPYEGGIDGVKGGNIATMRMDEYGHFVADRLETVFSVRQNSIGKSLRYYVAVGEGSEILGSKSAAHLKELASDLDGVEDHEGRKKILAEVTRYLRGLKMKTEGR